MATTGFTLSGYYIAMILASFGRFGTSLAQVKSLDPPSPKSVTGRGGTAARGGFLMQQIILGHAPAPADRATFERVPFFQSLSPVLLAVLAVLVASNFDTTVDYIVFDAGLTECTLNHNGTLVEYGLKSKPKTVECGLHLVGFDVAKAAFISIACACVLRGLEKHTTSRVGGASGKTLSRITKALFMWVGWTWKNCVETTT